MTASPGTKLKGFMKLPPELRLQIYEYVFGSFLERRLPHPLMETSMLVAKECTPVLIQRMQLMVIATQQNRGEKFRDWRVYHEYCDVPLGDYHLWSKFCESGLTEHLPSLELKCRTPGLTASVRIKFEQGQLSGFQLETHSRSWLSESPNCELHVKEKLEEMVPLWNMSFDGQCRTALFERVAQDLQGLVRVIDPMSFQWISAL